MSAEVPVACAPAADAAGAGAPGTNPSDEVRPAATVHARTGYAGAGYATTRARLLMITMLGAALWIIMSVLGSGSAAFASDDTGDDHSLVGSLTEVLESAVTEPVASGTAPEVAALIDSAPIDSAPVDSTAPNDAEPVESSAPVDSTVVVDSIAEPAIQAVEELAPPIAAVTADTLKATTAVVKNTVINKTVVNKAVHPLLDQPLVTSTIAWLTGIVHDADALVPLAPHGTPVAIGSTAAGDGLPASTTPRLAQVEPVTMHSLGDRPSASVDTTDAPAAPDAPQLPTSPETTAPTPGPSAPQLAATLDTGATVSFHATVLSAQDDALPSSVTFDTDCSPD